jgi:transposase
MSKARLVITAIVVEGRSQSAVAREYGVSQGWISRLVTRYRLEGELHSSHDHVGRTAARPDYRRSPSI